MLAARLSAVVGVLVLLVPSARGAIPGADDPKVLTENEYQKQVLEYNLRTTAEVYKESGERDEEWDAKAIAALEGMALYFTATGSWWHPQIQGAPSAEELLKLAQEAMDAGCEDPLVVYCKAMALDTLGREEEEAHDLLDESTEGLNNDRYPAYRLFASATRLMHHVEDQRAVMGEWWDAFQTALRAFERMGKAPEDQVERRLALEQFLKFYDGFSAKDKQDIYIDVSAEGLDPWIDNMVKGHMHRALAWEARGGDYADTVTPEGWKGFREHMTLAAECFTAAWKAQPTLPEAPTAMIEVAMSQRTDDERTWFDRAVAAQFDYNKAYTNYLWSIRPRWGGSLKRMYDFGEECLATGRFDTRVPYYLVSTLEDIRDEMGGSYALWRRPAVYAKLREALLGYEQRAPWYRSYLAAASAQVGKYDDARATLDELGDKFDRRGFARLMEYVDRGYSGIYAVTGPQGEKVNTANVAAFTEDYDAAIKLLEEAKSEADEKDKSWYYLNCRLRELQITRDLETGEWVDVNPSQPSEVPWQFYNGGGWTADASSVTVTGSGATQIAVLGVGLGTDYEMEGTVELLNPAAQRQGAGIVVGFDDESDQYTLWLRNGPPRASMRWPSGWHKDAACPVQESNTFKIVMRGGKGTITVNGKTVFEDYDVNEPIQSEDLHVGLGGMPTVQGAQVKYSNLRIRKPKEGKAQDAEVAPAPPQP